MAKNLLPGEMAILEELGWKQGDPIPDGLAQVLHSGGPEKAKQLLDASRTAAAMGGEGFQLPPDVQAAVQAAMGSSGLQITEPEAKEKKEEPKAEPKPEPEEKSKKEEYCVNCGWDLNNKEVTPVSDDDKRGYIAAIVNNRLTYKTYSLLGGSVKVTLRNLRPSEIDACFFQRTMDFTTQAGRSISDFEQLTRYRLALSLSEITYEDGRIQRFPSSLAEWRTMLGKPDGSPADVFKHLLEHFIASESFMRILCRTCVDFTYYLRRLEEAATAVDFWNPTR